MTVPPVAEQARPIESLRLRSEQSLRDLRTGDDDRERGGRRRGPWAAFNPLRDDVVGDKDSDGESATSESHGTVLREGCVPQVLWFSGPACWRAHEGADASSLTSE